MCDTGSDILPRLFGASLPLTLVAAPAASAFLGRSGVSRDRAVHQLYRVLAASIVGEQSHNGMKESASSTKGSATSLENVQPCLACGSTGGRDNDSSCTIPQCSADCAGFAILHWIVVAPVSAPSQHDSGSGAAAAAAARTQQAARQERLHLGLADLQDIGNQRNAQQGIFRHAANDSQGERTARALQQLDGSAGANASLHHGASRGLQQIVSIKGNSSTGTGSGLLGAGSRDGPAATHSLLGSPQQAVRAAFYLWVSAANLVAVSTMWARAADAFDTNAAARLASNKVA